MTDLQKRIEEAAHGVHGGCLLSFDGDCFAPPPWRAAVSRWAVSGEGRGDTPERAIEAALADLEAKQGQIRYASPEDLIDALGPEDGKA